MCASVASVSADPCPLFPSSYPFQRRFVVSENVRNRRRSIRRKIGAEKRDVAVGVVGSGIHPDPNNNAVLILKIFSIVPKDDPVADLQPPIRALLVHVRANRTD